MSTRLTRNSSTQIKRNNENNTGKNYTVVQKEKNSRTAFCDASKRKTFPCQYCAKVFPKKKSSMNHMRRCPKKSTTIITGGKNLENNNTDSNFDDNSNVDNNQYVEVLNDSGSSQESDGLSENLNPKIKICQNITVKAPIVKTEIFSSYENESPSVKTENSSLPIEDSGSGDVSMCDYNEDISGSLTYSEINRCVEDRKCKHCHKFFENPLDLPRHSRIYHLPLEEVEKYFDYPNRSFCPICKKHIKTMNYKSAFVKHLLVHTDGLAHECSICKKRCRRRDHMGAHEKMEFFSSPENSKPSDPRDIFTYENEIPSVNADISSLPIEDSASGGVSMYDYNEDISGSMTYSEINRCVEDAKCKHCHKFFENPLDLLRHSRIYHNPPKKILPLGEVEKYFDYPNRSFCPICEKPIKTRNYKSNFVKHLLVHTNGLAHECTICKKRFRRRDHMRAHEKRHIVNG